MEVNKLSIKTRILTGLLSGTIYAILMASFNYFNEATFSVFKFLFNLIFFGLFIGIAVKYSAKKSNK